MTLKNWFLSKINFISICVLLDRTTFTGNIYSYSPRYSAHYIKIVHPVHIGVILGGILFKELPKLALNK